MSDYLQREKSDWRWIVEARLDALRMQSLPDDARKEAVTIARTVMMALTAYNTPIGHSPLVFARQLANDLAKPYSAAEDTALHCAALLFFFDQIEGKEYHNIGLPHQFWRFGERILNQIGFDHRPFFSTGGRGADPDESEAEAWLVERAKRVRRVLAAVAGEHSRDVRDGTTIDGFFE